MRGAPREVAGLLGAAGRAPGDRHVPASVASGAGPAAAVRRGHHRHGLLLPEARRTRPFWANIVGRVNAVIEGSRPRTGTAAVLRPGHAAARDKILSKWGGFMDECRSTRSTFGIPPKSLRLHRAAPTSRCSEPCGKALLTRGTPDRAFPRERTAAILASAAGACRCRWRLPGVHAAPRLDPGRAHLVAGLATVKAPPGMDRGLVPRHPAERRRRPGGQPVRPGRSEHGDRCRLCVLARRAHAGGRKLMDGTSDVAIVMGAARKSTTPFATTCLRQDACPAPRAAAGRSMPRPTASCWRRDRGRRPEAIGRCRSATATGSTPSSRGSPLAATAATRASRAPRRRASSRALPGLCRRPAFAARVGLVEAHGTGTVVGDRTELSTLTDVFVEQGAERATVTLGSVKSKSATPSAPPASPG